MRAVVDRRRVNLAQERAVVLDRGVDTIRIGLHLLFRVPLPGSCLLPHLCSRVGIFTSYSLAILCRGLRISCRLLGLARWLGRLRSVRLITSHVGLTGLHAELLDDTFTWATLLAKGAPSYLLAQHLALVRMGGKFHRF